MRGLITETLYFARNSLFSQYNPDASPDPLTVVAFGDEYLGLYFIGDKTAMYPPGSSVKIETKVKEYTLTEGTKSLLLESWWWIYISGLMSNPDTNINVQFYDDEDQDRLLVTSTEMDLFWADFEIDGICDISNLGTNVVPGDIISDCSGTITITYTPNNQLMGIWDFS